MNRVVVGFDFSSGSARAVDLAIDVANRLESDLRLVYVKEKTEDEAPVREEIERRIAAVEPLLHGIKMDYLLREGNPPDELAAQAEADNAVLLVVGTHGMSGLKTNVLGRNTYRTIEISPAPVLIVREDFNFSKALETIVLPIDSSDETRQKVAEAMMFAKNFGSTIHLLGLYTSQTPDIRRIVTGYVKMVQKHLTQNEVRYITKTINVEKNVTLTTLDYANTVGADLIVIMTEQEKNFNSMLLGTYAQQMLNESKIPILTVRPKAVMTENANY
jgi:nucleotide-binding universal stress UspA family protein